MALTFGFIGFVGFRWIFLAAGMAVILGGFAIFPVRVPAAITSEDRFVFRREYLTYYLLTFFQGCRRQIFVVFAVFSMVFVHGVTTEQIIVLMFVNTLLAVLAAPLVGGLIDRLGERKILSVAYSMLILIFWGYSSIQNTVGALCPLLRGPSPVSGVRILEHLSEQKSPAPPTCARPSHSA